MSGWNTGDNYMEEDVGDDFPAMNNITVGGYLPSDMVPSPSKSYKVSLSFYLR
jgi:hypothetical protein